ncbi:glutaredoxin 3 [Oceanibacterium hippocampi]|uniref:Glutaredoxin n=1 Tax=Oceanibacterium hippocampi TaxID=745714 RepID=A0A1Y5R7C5_9PROT|nr:glutaredoxin 3 [Oceanibacterium hippocampi]SLN10206.1 Glutaredoxin-3 [Oceanibacterium hippocampi]
MPNVTIYTTMMCPYCFRAKKLLTQKGVKFDEIDVGTDPGLRREMTTRSNGGQTVPQIFIGKRHVGGCDELFALEARGELDAALQAA